MEEEWRDIKGYEGLYQVSNLGNVKSIGRKRLNKGTYGGYFSVKEKILKPSIQKNRYCSVELSKNGLGKRINIHRLVAEAFIPNPNNYTCVNHKDENKINNRVENLEWCTQKYNSNYGTRNEKLRRINENKLSTFVVQYSLDYIFLKKYNSIYEASKETKINRKGISGVCNGKRKTAGGYIWKFLKKQEVKL